MSADFLKGDLFRDDGLKALAHGCNCAGAMGRGIALEFRARFPFMYTEYKRRCADGRFVPGDVFVWVEQVTVFNLATQKTWRTKARLVDVEKSMKEMVSQAERMNIDRIGMPRIGSGLGGLPWDEVRASIVALSRETDVNLLVFEL